MSRRITAVIPAHNEQDCLPATIASLKTQTRPPDRIIVVSDNSTDKTVEVARSLGSEIEVVETVGNTAKKAGALNFVLARILPEMTDDDFVFVQDADSALDRDFLKNALRYMSCIDNLGAIGGVFRGQEGGGFVGHLQRNEYARYTRDVSRLKGKCLVVTGTAALFRAQTLAHISRERLAGTIPIGDGKGGVYDTTVLTEDNEISFALMHLGYKILSPAKCTLTTEVMPTWRELWNQRLRWKRGAVENCLQYGLTKITLPYWGRQIFTMLGVLVTVVYLSTIVWSIVFLGALNIHPFWLAVTAIFALERVVTLRGRGTWRRIAVGTMYELPFDIFMQLCHGKAYLDSVFKTERKW